MSPHTSYMLQPLDVGCFVPLKFAYTKELAARQRIRIFHVGKDDFLPMYERARKISINRKNIKKSFEASGIVPFNSDRVISKLDFCIRTPSGSLISEEAESDSGTPKNIKQLIRHQAITHEVIASGNASPRELKRRFDQSFKANEISFVKLARSAKEAGDLHKANGESQKKLDKER